MISFLSKFFLFYLKNSPLNKISIEFYESIQPEDIYIYIFLTINPPFLRDVNVNMRGTRTRSRARSVMTETLLLLRLPAVRLHFDI